MGGQTPTRADDERLLEMLARRCAGETAGAIGAEMGLSKSAVLGQTHRVRVQDLAHACPPEDRCAVMQAYWEVAT